jgi:hypothetical protein
MKKSYSPYNTQEAERETGRGQGQVIPIKGKLPVTCFLQPGLISSVLPPLNNVIKLLRFIEL